MLPDGTTVVLGPNDALARLQKDRNFVVVTQDYPHEELRPQKVRVALVFFLIAVPTIPLTLLMLTVREPRRWGVRRRVQPFRAGARQRPLGCGNRNSRGTSL